MTIPSLTFARIATPGGPYAEGDVVSLAFGEPTVARLLPHAGDARPQRRGDAIVPESVSATILVAAPPYAAGDAVTLSFVDPAVARVHAVPSPAPRPNDGRPLRPTPVTHSALVRESDAPSATAGPRGGAFTVEASLGDADEYAAVRRTEVARSGADAFEADRPNADRPNADRANVISLAATAPRFAIHRLRLDWPSERAERFVRVADKLFTVDRLGWYRHVLATRLLVADGVVTARDDRGVVRIPERIATSLRLVRTAGLEALGAPLLAAYLPSFTVTSDWLQTLENEALAASLATLSADLGTLDVEAGGEVEPEPDALSGVLPLGGTLEVGGRLNADAALPYLVPSVAHEPAVTVALTRYRDTLLELFGQVAPAAGAVRVRQLAQPNAILDDRLWHLVGAVQQTLSTDAAARA